MKKIICFLSALMASCVLVGCSSNGDKEIAMRSAAWSIADDLSNEVTKADLLDCGMRKEATQEFNILLKDGVCTVSAADTQNFAKNGAWEWGSAGRSDSDQENQGEKKIADTILKNHQNLSYLSIYAVIYDNGKKVYVACTNDDDTILQPGVNCPKVSANGGDFSFSYDYEIPKGVIIGSYYSSKCQYKDLDGSQSCTNNATHGDLCDDHFKKLDDTYHQYAG